MSIEELMGRAHSGHWSDDDWAAALDSAQVENAKLRAEVERLCGEERYHKAKIEALELHLKDAHLQVEAWKKYHTLLSDELDSAVSMAWIHGWRSTDEKIALGKKLRAELGLPDNEIDAAIKEQASEKQVGDKCPRCDLPVESEAHREECR